MADAHANFATSLVAIAPVPAASGISLTVTAGEGARFPAVPFNAVICPAASVPTPANAEVVRVTARVTDVLTITRTQESSSARTVVVGDRIYAAVTAKTLTDVESPVTRLGLWKSPTLQVACRVAGSTAAGTYYLSYADLIRVSGTNAGPMPTTVYLDDAEYTLSGYTAKMRLAVVLMTNATAPAATFTFGLYPITSVAGAATGVTTTLGTVVSGSTVEIATPAASTRSHAESSAFDLPADGYYCIGVVTSGATTAANSYEHLAAHLQHRHV